MVMGRRTWASDDEREGWQTDNLEDHETRLDSLETVVTPGAGLVGDISQVDSGDTAAAGATGRYADAAHQHAVPTPGTPAASAVGDTASVGTGTKLALDTHRHAREGFGSPSTSAVGDAAANGSATSLPRSDHVHGREGFGAVTAAIQGGSAANGTAATVSHSDHDHGWPTAAPRGELGAASITSDSATFTTTEVVITGLTKSVTVGTSRKVKIEVTVLLNTDAAGDLVRIRIRNGLTTSGTELRVGQRKLTTLGGNGQETLTFFARGVFSGAQDFCVTGERASGSGNCKVIATSANPAEMVITDTGG